MSRMCRFAAAGIFCVFVPAVVLAYPISPVPLWPLTAEAELIVVAEVTGTADLPRDEKRWDSAVAHLRVIETLKGPERSTVDVPYPANLLCPAPPRYWEGETVVAFLTREKKQWQTVALSYGTLYPQGLELEEMKTMIHAALAIQQSGLSSRAKELRKQSWLVQAAALPGTRWHGLYELAPGSDRLRSFYDETGRPARLPLTPRQRTLLAEAFVKTPKMDPTLGMMLRVLGKHQDPRVDEVALGALEGLLAREEPPWWVRDLLWEVLARFGDRKLEGRLEERGLNSWDLTPEQLRTLWTEAKAELAIPDVPPQEVEIEPHLPVGGRTPS